MIRGLRDLVDLCVVDVRGSRIDSLSQRAKNPASGGKMVAFSPSSVRQRSVRSIWSPRTALGKGVGAAPTRDAEDAE